MRPVHNQGGYAFPAHAPAPSVASDDNVWRPSSSLSGQVGTLQPHAQPMPPPQDAAPVVTPAPVAAPARALVAPGTALPFRRASTGDTRLPVSSGGGYDHHGWYHNAPPAIASQVPPPTSFTQVSEGTCATPWTAPPHLALAATTGSSADMGPPRTFAPPPPQQPSPMPPAYTPTQAFTLPTHVAHAAHGAPLGDIPTFPNAEPFSAPTAPPAFPGVVGDSVPLYPAYLLPTPPAPPRSTPPTTQTPPAAPVQPLTTPTLTVPPPTGAFVFGGVEPGVEPALVHPAAVACNAWRRGARCSGTRPCSGCAARGTRCLYGGGGGSGVVRRRGSLGPPPHVSATPPGGLGLRRASDAGIDETRRKRRFANDGAPGEYLSPLRARPYVPTTLRSVRSAGQLVPPAPTRRRSVPALAGAPAWTPPTLTAGEPMFELPANEGVRAGFTFPPHRPALSPFPSVLGAVRAAALLAPLPPPPPTAPERTLSTQDAITPPPAPPARSASCPTLPDLPGEGWWSVAPASPG